MITHLKISNRTIDRLIIIYFFFKQLDSEEVDADPDSPEDEPDFYTEAPLPG